MGWEKRGNRSYYYQKRREGNRVVSEYVGSGRVAELAARLQELQHNGEETDRSAMHGGRLSRREIEELDREIAQMCNLIQSLTEMTLTANGYHKHKGEWRHKRDEE